MPTNTGGGHRTARAHRHVAEIPAMYRVVGNEEWTHGLTTNISASGVLLQAAWPLALRARIEMRFQIPEPIASFPGGQVQRLGEVVRFGQSTPTTPFPTAARFVEIDRVDPSLRDTERNDTARRRGDEANARALTTFVEGVSAENRKLERLLQALDRQACELERELQGLSLEPVTATTVDGPPRRCTERVRRQHVPEVLSSQGVSVGAPHPRGEIGGIRVACGSRGRGLHILHDACRA